MVRAKTLPSGREVSARQFVTSQSEEANHYHSPQLRHLGIKSSYNRLQRMLNLQCELISAHPTRSSLMLETYKLNYTVEDMNV